MYRDQIGWTLVESIKFRRKDSAGERKGTKVRLLLSEGVLQLGCMVYGGKATGGKQHGEYEVNEANTKPRKQRITSLSLFESI